MIRLNLNKFSELQGNRTETDMSAHIGVDRTQLWRIKKGKCSVGEEFISKLMARYPDIQFGEIFITDEQGIT